MTTKIYSVQEVADIVGVETITVRRRIKDGKLSAFRTNGNSGPYRITQQALDEFLSYREAHPYGEAGYKAGVQ